MALVVGQETAGGESVMISIPLTGQHARELRRVLLAMLEEASEATGEPVIRV